MASAPLVVDAAYFNVWNASVPTQTIFAFARHENRSAAHIFITTDPSLLSNVCTEMVVPVHSFKGPALLKWSSDGTAKSVGLIGSAG
jgi:hypothetical protein